MGIGTGLSRRRGVGLPTNTTDFAGKPGLSRLPKEDAPGTKVREGIPFSMQASFAPTAERYASKLGGTVSRLLEVLVAEDRASGRREFMIWPASRR